MTLNISTDPECFGFEDDQTEEAEACAQYVAAAVVRRYGHLGVRCHLGHHAAPCWIEVATPKSEALGREILDWVETNWSRLSRRPI